MSRNRQGYTLEEYGDLSKNIIGSLVSLAIGEKNYGVGIVLSHRRYHGYIHIKVAWLNSPRIRFKTMRRTEWLSYDRIRFISRT
tara:strand:- start:4125 stop:4376 length:252 start_codon:yes stop_codon:yes gene_type:complete